MLVVSEGRMSGTYKERASAGNKKDNAAACLYFLNYLAFLWPAADRAGSILSFVEIRLSALIL
jgi:hypothetical protein